MDKIGGVSVKHGRNPTALANASMMSRQMSADYSGWISCRYSIFLCGNSDRKPYLLEFQSQLEKRIDQIRQPAGSANVSGKKSTSWKRAVQLR